MSFLDNIKNTIKLLESNDSTNLNKKKEFNEIVFRHVGKTLLYYTGDFSNNNKFKQFVLDFYKENQKVIHANFTIEFFMYTILYQYVKKEKPFNFELVTWLYELKPTMKWTIIFDSLSIRENELCEKLFNTTEIIELFIQRGIQVNFMIMTFEHYYNNLLPPSQKGKSKYVELMNLWIDQCREIDQFDTLLGYFFEILVSVEEYELCEYLVKERNYSFTNHINVDEIILNKRFLNKLNAKQKKFVTDLFQFAMKNNLPKMFDMINKQ